MSNMASFGGGATLGVGFLASFQIVSGCLPAMNVEYFEGVALVGVDFSTSYLKTFPSLYMLNMACFVRRRDAQINLYYVLY